MSFRIVLELLNGYKYPARREMRALAVGVYWCIHGTVTGVYGELWGRPGVGMGIEPVLDSSRLGLVLWLSVDSPSLWSSPMGGVLSEHINA